MAEGVCVYDEQGCIVYANPAENDMFGYERGELIGKHLSIQTAYRADENEIVISRIIEKLRREGSWKGELLNRSKEGTSFYTKARISILEGNGARYWICIREKAGESLDSDSLRETKETLQALIVASPLPIVAFTRNGAITVWNPAAERVFGWSEAEVLGKPLPFIPEEKKGEHREMRDRDLRGETFTSREIRRRRKDGTPIDISVSTAAIHDVQGNIMGIMSVYVDITEQKKLADEQRRSMETFAKDRAPAHAPGGGVRRPAGNAGVRKGVGTILELAQRFIQAEAYAVWRKMVTNGT